MIERSLKYLKVVFFKSVYFHCAWLKVSRLELDQELGKLSLAGWRIKGHN